MRDEGGKTDPLEAGPRHPALAALARRGRVYCGVYGGMFMFITVRPYTSLRRATYGRQSGPVRHVRDGLGARLGPGAGKAYPVTGCVRDELGTT